MGDSVEYILIYSAGAVFGGALFAFCVSRLPMLDIDGFYRSAGGIGEYFYIRQHLYTGDRLSGHSALTLLIGVQVGFILHLVGILLANILAVFQFVPAIRHVSASYQVAVKDHNKGKHNRLRTLRG